MTFDEKIVAVLGEPLEAAEQRARALADRIRPTVADLQEQLVELDHDLARNEGAVAVSEEARVRQVAQRNIYLRQIAETEAKLNAALTTAPPHTSDGGSLRAVPDPE